MRQDPGQPALSSVVDPGEARLRQLYDHKYRDEVWEPLILRPHALSTNRFDDVGRLLTDATGRALEVGCGSGRLTLALASRFTEIVGMDLSPVRVARANAVVAQAYPALASRVRFQVGNAEKPLAFADATFDVVIACAVIEHLVEIFDAMREISRVCRPGGTLVVCVPNICYVKHAAALLLDRVPLTGSHTRDVAYWREDGWDGGHLHYFSKRSLADLLLLNGFVPEQWTGDGRLAALRRWHHNLVGSLTVRARRTTSPAA